MIDKTKTAFIGYVKQEDQYQLSSIGSRWTRRRRKKIIPTKYNSDNASTTIYTRPCLDHDKPVTLISVELVFYMPQTGTTDYFGIAKVCPLCWYVVEPPKDGFHEVSNEEQEIIDGRLMAAVSAVAKKKRRTTKRTPVKYERVESVKVKRTPISSTGLSPEDFMDD